MKMWAVYFGVDEGDPNMLGREAIDKPLGIFLKKYQAVEWILEQFTSSFKNKLVVIKAVEVSMAPTRDQSCQEYWPTWVPKV